MSESPDIPALIAEAREFVQAENWESDYERDGGNTVGTGLIGRLADALAALSVSQPSGTSVAAMIEERYPLNGSDPDTAIALRNAARVGAALAAARSSVQPTTASSEELAEAFKEAHYDSALDAYGDEGAGYDWDAAVSAFLTSPAHRAAFPSVPTVTAEQIAEAARIIFGEYTGNAALGFDKPAYSHDRQKAERVAAAVLARSGGAPNFNSQPDLKETGTSGGAPTAQQVPSIAQIERAIEAELTRMNYIGWLLSNGSNRLWESKTPESETARVIAPAVLALLSAQPAETEWEYGRYNADRGEIELTIDRRATHRRALPIVGLWEPVPADEGGEKA